MNAGLQKGYATATTDTGHDAAKEPLGTFAERRPDNPNADRKKLDYAYLAVHNTAVLAKQIIKALLRQRAEILLLGRLFDRRATGIDGSATLSRRL